MLPSSVLTWLVKILFNSTSVGLSEFTNRHPIQCMDWCMDWCPNEFLSFKNEFNKPYAQETKAHLFRVMVLHLCSDLITFKTDVGRLLDNLLLDQ